MATPTSNLYVLEKHHEVSYERDGEGVTPASYRNPILTPLSPVQYLAVKGGYTTDPQQARTFPAETFLSPKPGVERWVAAKLVLKEDPKP